MSFSLDILGFYGGFPVIGEAASSYLITVNGVKILVDCGSGALLKLSLLQEIYDLDAVIISHLHNDHVADLLSLDHALIVAKRRGIRQSPLPLYLPFQPEEIYQRFETEQFQIFPISTQSRVEFSGLVISFFPVQHTIPCFSVKISAGDKTWAFTGDTAFFPELIPFVQEADLLLCEATVNNHSQHSSGRGHMTGRQAGKLAQAARVANLILTHLPSDGYHQEIKEEAATEFQGPLYLACEKRHWDL